MIATYPIAVLKAARNPEAARQFVELVSSDAGQRVLQRNGLLPAEIALEAGATVDDAIRLLKSNLREDQQLPKSCLLAVSGEHIGTLASYTNRPLRDRDELILIAPVAGG